MTHLLPARAATPALVLALLVSLTGCGTAGTGGAAAAQPAAHEAPPDSLELVVRAHANAAAPDLPMSLQPLVTEAVEAERPITLIRLDGSPAITWRSGHDQLSTDSDQAHEDDVNRELQAVLDAVHELRPTADGADLAGAISMARDDATASGVRRPTIVVVDSGLSDGGMPSLTNPGVLDLQPAELAGIVAEKHGITDLAHARLVLCGFGYTTAPQHPLTPAMRTTVTSIWTAVLRRAGADDVTVLPEPPSGPGPRTSFTVRTVPVERDTVPTTGTSVWRSQGPIGFRPGTTELRDPAAAARALAALAAWLRADPHHSARIEGTTAGGGSEAANRALGRGRADRVLAVLEGAGVAGAQLQAEGVGSHFPGYVPDVLPDGSLDPELAALNRTVRIAPVP